MELNILKRIIEEQRKELEKKFNEENIIERENTNEEKKFLKYPNILAILGVRRSGKSIFSLIISKQLKNFAYINFDDERLLNVKTEDLNKILQAFYELQDNVDLIILDEIQNINGWELFVNRLRRLKKYIEGSGFPEFLKFGSAIVIRIYEDIINKDCLRRHKVEKEKTFRELSNYLISNFSSEFTYSKLSKIFNIKDVHTVKNYVNYLKEAFLIIVLVILLVLDYQKIWEKYMKI